ncbi:MAG: hypothetical protein HZB37_03740 [Planctomycetes bacterium]|nr:hypothetical protein [Planctomycetota bacterium]HJW86326.1 hypothetical protein [Candidatus Brocadiaceae bacterium]
MNTLKRHFAICIDNTDYAASLIVKKLYEVLPDEEAAKDGFLRIIDESGEDYLYHGSQFVLIELPIEVEQALVSV